MTYVNGGSVIAIGVLLPTLGIAGVLLRFRVRMAAKKVSLGQDDWMCLAALVSGPFIRSRQSAEECGAQIFEIGCGITMIVGAVCHDRSDFKHI